MLTILVVLIKIGSFTSDKEVRAYDSIVCLAKSGTSAWQSHTHDPHQVGMLLKAMFLIKARIHQTSWCGLERRYRSCVWNRIRLNAMDARVRTTLADRNRVDLLMRAIWISASDTYQDNPSASEELLIYI